MKDVLESFWMLLKTIIEGYIFDAEADYPPGSGQAKKDAVIKSVQDLLKTIGQQYSKIPAWFISLVSLLVPWIIDALVAQLNNEGKLKPHQAATAASGV